MRHLGLAALVIGLLPTAALAGDRSRFNLFLGFGGFGFGYHSGYVASLRYEPCLPPVCSEPEVIVQPAPEYCDPPVVYVPAPRVYYAPIYRDHYYYPGHRHYYHER